MGDGGAGLSHKYTTLLKDRPGSGTNPERNYTTKILISTDDDDRLRHRQDRIFHYSDDEDFARPYTNHKVLSLIHR